MEHKYTEKDLQKMLEHPKDFGYSGDNDKMFTTWALGEVIQHRDSDVFTRANAKALLKELEKRKDLNGRWEITGCNHWAVGWVDHLSFQVLKKNLKGPKRFAPENHSPMLDFMWGIQCRLENYPVLDEGLLSEMEMEEIDKEWEAYGESDFRNFIVGTCEYKSREEQVNTLFEFMETEFKLDLGVLDSEILKDKISKEINDPPFNPEEVIALIKKEDLYQIWVYANGDHPTYEEGCSAFECDDLDVSKIHHAIDELIKGNPVPEV